MKTLENSAGAIPSTPSNNSGLRDNRSRGSAADFLRARIQSGSKLSIVSAYFTTYVDAKDTREVVDIGQLNADLASTVAKIDRLRTDIDAIVAEIEGEEVGA